MINRIPELAQAGIDVFRIETIGSHPDAVEVQVRTYLEALARYNEDPAAYEDDPTHWDALKAVCPDGFTTGHFFRGPQ